MDAMSTVVDYLAAYLRERLDFSKSSVSWYRAAVNGLDAWHRRPVRLDELSRDLLLAFLAELGRTHPPATVNSRRGALLTLWRSAADAELCPPPPKIPKRKAPRRDPVAWTIDEVGRILAACDGLPGQWAGVPIGACWRVALLLLWDTAVRLDAVARAKVADVDLDGGTWFVPAEHIKGRAADRVFVLHGDTLAAIRSTLPSDREMLFPFPFQRRQIWPHFKAILRAAGLPDDRRHLFHCVRRTAESYAAAARGDEWAARAVGHSLAVAQQSYISRRVAPQAQLVDAIPRPANPAGNQRRPALRIVS